MSAKSAEYAIKDAKGRLEYIYRYKSYDDCSNILKMYLE